MAILDPIYAKPLSVRLIPRVDLGFAEKLHLRQDQVSIGLITSDNDDATYVSIDHATKMADVEVVYAHSFYAGAKHSSGLLSGEILAILAGPDPNEVGSGLDATIEYMKKEAVWYAANEDASVTFFPHVISQTGSYLSRMNDLPVSSPIAYLVAPPMEGLVAIDAALKIAAVSIASLFMPPTETNFMGAVLSGDQSACKAAAAAFQNKILEVVRNPIQYV